MQQLNLEAIACTAEVLENLDPDRRLHHLRKLCETNGVWAIPADTSAYRPAMFEISLFGVAAISDCAMTLPRNWVRAARNILRATEAEEAA